MVYERRILSLRELLSELEELAPDEGARVGGNYGGEDCFVFVTRHSGKYAIWLRARRAGGRIRGGVNEFKDFSNLGLLKKFLVGVITEPLRAHMY